MLRTSGGEGSALTGVHNLRGSNAGSEAGMHSLLADTTSLVRLLEAGGANLSALGLQKDGASPSELVSATRLHYTEIHPTPPHATVAADSHSLTDVLCRLQAEFHNVFVTI
ncbi:hypothetical protein J005_05997 [Cryptococcus neoformans]|nr:hypothetical protein C344_05863 [Cryptococcus neoformans var. grubii AD1-7a]OXH24450.1 hypothetical protein J005_05997 [Cryptococcus neoformans var. grubii]